MLDCAIIPLSVLNDRRLSRGDIREYGLLSAQPSGEGISLRDMDRSERRRIHRLVRLGYVGIERDSNGTRCRLTEKTEIQQMRQTTVSDFAEVYRAYAQGVHTPKTVETYQTAFRELARVIGNVPLDSIGVRELENFLAVKRNEASDFTARKYYISLASAFEKAVEWNYISENPFRKVRKPKVPERIPAYFTASEFQLFLSGIIDKDFREFCTTGILTGLRLWELINLRWKDIDFARKWIIIQNHDDFMTKSKRSRVVPMTRILFRLISERRENIRSESEYIFPNKHGKRMNVGLVERKFKETVRAVGLNDRLHFHSLRHSFSSALVSYGVPLYTVSKLLGHSQLRTTEGYAHLFPGELHSEVNKLDKGFGVSSNSAQR